MKQRRDVVIIVNPIAGRGRGLNLVGRFRRRLFKAGIRCALVRPRSPDDLPHCVARHATGDTVIAIGGGDGTIRNALPGLVGRPNPLLILPLGTENLLAKSLGIQPGSEPIWRLFTAGRPATMDLATLNGRPFAMVLGVGFDAEVVRRVAFARRGNITQFSYVRPFFDTFWSYRFPALRVIADGREVCDEPALVFVGNIARYAMGLQILQRARWDDGLLDVCVLRCRNQTQLVEHAAWTLLNWHTVHPRVSYHRARRVRLESSAPVRMQSDGDPAGRLPADVAVVPGAIRVLVPDGAHAPVNC